MNGTAVTRDRPAALPELLGNQARASAPDSHIWLSASAGTGKTQVLAARVFRLLLRGIDPGAILCLTFTKAGATEMARRISDRLAAWVRMPDAELRRDLHHLGEPRTDDAAIANARTLFAKVLDAPGGGIRIQTIHGFCQSLLAAFPVEAGLLPGFRPLDQREQNGLARETLAALLVDAEREGRARTIDTIAALSLRLGEGGAEAFLLDCARAPAALAALPSGIAPALRRALDLPVGSIADALASACCDEAIDGAALREVARQNALWGTATGLKRADAIAAWLAQSPAVRAQNLQALTKCWSLSDGGLASFARGRVPQTEEYPALATRLHGYFADLTAMPARAAYADLLADALAVGRDYADAYGRAKRQIGAVDFDDLIRATVALLAQSAMSDWVRYKLDQTTDHVLIDEAQDTNAQQWAIVRALVMEFFAGAGTRGDTTRTLFVVGDYKQAIFGFQGTDPINFAAAQKLFARLAADAYDAETGSGTTFDSMSLTHSFRSTRPVLEFVDAAIAALPPPGLGFADVDRHGSQVPGPGTVSLWPPFLPGEGAGEEEEEGWASDSDRALASHIARQVRGWLHPAGALMLESKGRAVRPEDVMILVRRRGELASLIVARLYAEGVPVAGIDRLRLNAPLAVQDLLAVIRFVLQPDDDLSLATLLVSPLFGFTQGELMAAATPRDGVSLWRHLRANQPDAVLAPLYTLLARADIATPYRLLEELLSGPLDGRRKFLHRLGQEALDPVEELLSAALDFETRSTPSLQAFLDWFDRGDVDIVRDPSAPLDAVRVMTVHGAKGLQAPLVILADATVDPGRAMRPKLNWRLESSEEPFPILYPRKAERAPPLEALIEHQQARDMAEHWRLFYVAATRAEERLIIAGALGPAARGVPAQASWYALADRAMTALGVAAERGADRHFFGTKPQGAVAARKRVARVHEKITLPGWAHLPAPQEARPPRPLAPSSLGPDMVSDPPPTAAMRAAAERGRLLHSLFQRLPPVDPQLRASVANRWLATAAGVEDEGVRTELVKDCLAVLNHADFAEVFQDGALAEAPIAAVLPNGLVVSGTVDRLLVDDARVLVVDFKTTRRPPPALDALPAYHVRQMAAYVEALGVIFPGRKIEAALLYTAGPVMFTLPPHLIDAHKPSFAAPEQSYEGLA